MPDKIFLKAVNILCKSKVGVG